MNIIMAGIDYHMATIDVRERFSFTKSAMEDAYNIILARENVLGSVIISTCNRTEIYVSCAEGVYMNPFELMCQATGADFKNYERLHVVRTGADVMKHLCELACGVKSQIWGEDQIITQVKNAITAAREMRASDSFLEVMFRNSVAAAKKVKSTLKLCDREQSVVYKALDIIKADVAVKNVLVIGNGEIGRLMSKVLAESGYVTTVTLRNYKTGVAQVADGVGTVDYADRYDMLRGCDAVVSATLSPHHTLELAELQALDSYPKLFIDLAVPRDIDPGVKTLPGVAFYDMDAVGADETNQNHAKQLAQVAEIIEKYIYDYKHWCSFKEGLVLV